MIFEKDFSLAHMKKINIYKMTPDAKYFYTAGAENQLKQWKTDTWTLAKDLSENVMIGRNTFIGMDITTQKGQTMYMLCGTTDGYLKIFHVEKKCLLKKIRMVSGKGCPNLIKVTQDGKYAVVCTTDRIIYKINIKRGTISYRSKKCYKDGWIIINHPFSNFSKSYRNDKQLYCNLETYRRNVVFSKISRKFIDRRGSVLHKKDLSFLFLQTSMNDSPDCAPNTFYFKFLYDFSAYNIHTFDSKRFTEKCSKSQ